MENVPEEILLQIFDLLQPNDVKNAAKVCAWWKSIIQNSPILMAKVYINISKHEQSDLPYQNIEVSGLHSRYNRNGEKFLTGLDTNQVKKLFISNSAALAVVKFLNNFCNLTTLAFGNSTTNGIQDHIVINLPSLTHLKMRHSEFRLLHAFRNHQIRCLRLSSAWSETEKWTKKQTSTFRIFIESLNELKHLTIDRFFTDQFLKLNGRLETLEVIRQKPPIRSAFLEFLNSQKSSLKNLHLAVSYIDDETQNFIYFEMNLEKLWDLRDACFVKREIKELKPIQLKSLGIIAYPKDFLFFEKLFSCCIHLEVLSINLPNGVKHEFLSMISSLLKLKFLCLTGDPISKDEFKSPTVSFEILEVLVLNGFTQRNCVTLSRCCPNIKKLKITPDNGKPLTMMEFDAILEICQKIDEIILCKIFELDEDCIQTFNSVGSKIILRIFVCRNKKNEEIQGQIKNRTIFMGNEDESDDEHFSVKFRILTDFYYDSDRYEMDIEYEDRNYDSDGYSS